MGLDYPLSSFQQVTALVTGKERVLRLEQKTSVRVERGSWKVAARRNSKRSRRQV